MSQHPRYEIELKVSEVGLALVSLRSLLLWTISNSQMRILHHWLFDWMEFIQDQCGQSNFRVVFDPLGPNLYSVIVHADGGPILYRTNQIAVIRLLDNKVHDIEYTGVKRYGRMAKTNGGLPSITVGNP